MHFFDQALASDRTKFMSSIFSVHAEHLVGVNGSIAERMGSKFQVSILYVGNDMLPPRDADLAKTFGTLFPRPLPDGRYEPCILLSGTKRKIESANKVITHILVSKAFSGDDKEPVKKALRCECVPKSTLSQVKIENGAGVERPNVEDAASDTNVDKGKMKTAEMQSLTNRNQPVGNKEDPVKKGVADSEEKIPNADTDSKEERKMRSQLKREVVNLVRLEGPFNISQVHLLYEQRFSKKLDLKSSGYEKILALLQDLSPGGQKCLINLNGHCTSTADICG